MQLHDAATRYTHWLTNVRNLSRHTVRAYRGDISIWLLHNGGDTDLSELNTSSVLTFIEDQRTKGLAERTILRRIAALPRLLLVDVGSRTCRGRHERDEDDTHPPATGPPAGCPRDDLRRLYDHLYASLQGGGSLHAQVRSRPREAAVLLAASIMLATGTRVGETTSIECSNIDLGGASIRVHGKGSRDRTVPIADTWLQGLLAAYLDVRSELKVSHQFLLFSDTGDPLNPAIVRLRLKKASKAAGLLGHVTPHMLRHAAATHLLEAGVDIRIVQRLLGHASITTTEIYTHVTDVALRQAISSANVLQRDFRA
ncbi:MAG: tyrosine-type recombinase/integrase [Galbitalea sp.]